MFMFMYCIVKLSVSCMILSMVHREHSSLHLRHEMAVTVLVVPVKNVVVVVDAKGLTIF